MGSCRAIDRRKAQRLVPFRPAPSPVFLSARQQSTDARRNNCATPRTFEGFPKQTGPSRTEDPLSKPDSDRWRLRHGRSGVRTGRTTQRTTRRDESDATSPMRRVRCDESDARLTKHTQALHARHGTAQTHNDSLVLRRTDRKTKTQPRRKELERNHGEPPSLFHGIDGCRRQLLRKTGPADRWPDGSCPKQRGSSVAVPR